MLEENTNIASFHEELEAEVKANMEKDSNYPLGEQDAMKWAIAWRLMLEEKGVDLSGLQPDGDVDGFMVGWFANCMASAPEAVKQRREKSESFVSDNELALVVNSLLFSQQDTKLETRIRSAIVLENEEEYRAISPDYTKSVDVVIVGKDIIKLRNG